MNATSYLIENYTETLNFEDPLLRFDDSTLYGCKMALTRSELEQLCASKNWQNLMLFENIYLLGFVGKYGVSNPHFTGEWIESEVDKAQDKSEITVDWDNNTGTCAFPSVHFLQIFYSKFNTKTHPQYQIVKVTHYSDTLNAWVFKKPDPALKQEFSAFLSIQFYEMDQEAQFYTP